MEIDLNERIIANALTDIRLVSTYAFLWGGRIAAEIILLEEHHLRGGIFSEKQPEVIHCCSRVCTCQSFMDVGASTDFNKFAHAKEIECALPSMIYGSRHFCFRS